MWCTKQIIHLEKYHDDGDDDGLLLIPFLSFVYILIPRISQLEENFYFEHCNIVRQSSNKPHSNVIENQFSHSLYDEIISVFDELAEKIH